MVIEAILESEFVDEPELVREAILEPEFVFELELDNEAILELDFVSKPELLLVDNPDRDFVDKAEFVNVGVTVGVFVVDIDLVPVDDIELVFELVDDADILDDKLGVLVVVIVAVDV